MDANERELARLKVTVGDSSEIGLASAFGLP